MLNFKAKYNINAFEEVYFLAQENPNARKNPKYNQHMRTNVTRVEVKK